MNLFKRRPAELDPDEENSVVGERDFSSVNKGVSLQNKLTNWAVIGGVSVLAGILLFKYYASVYEEYKQADVPSKDLARTVATTSLPPLTMPDPEPLKVSANSTVAEVLPPLQPRADPATITAGSAGQVYQRSMTELIRERRLKREVRFNLDGVATGSTNVQVSDEVRPAADLARSSVAEVERPANAISAGAVHASSDSASRAYRLADATFTMTRGRTIPCTVIPAIDTSLTGIVTCVTAEDASGADNRVSLMDRGTLCTGKQGGGVMQGQRRVGIIWQRCETPQHVLVPLDSGASDSLGRPGIAGVVDNHFWDRFGAAIALSLITDIGTYLAASRQDGSNNTTIAFPRIGGPQEVMAEVLKTTVNIPPTIKAPQGAQVLIYLAGDIDFRDVYQLERVKQP